MTQQAGSSQPCAPQSLSNHLLGISGGVLLVLDVLHLTNQHRLLLNHLHAGQPGAVRQGMQPSAQPATSGSCIAPARTNHSQHQQHQQLKRAARHAQRCGRASQHHSGASGGSSSRSNDRSRPGFGIAAGQCCSPGCGLRSKGRGRGRGGACPQAEAQRAARAYMTKRQPRFCLSSSRHPRQHAGVGLGIAASGREALLPAHGSRRQPTRRPPPTVVQVGVLCDFQQRADAGKALRKRRAAQQGFRIGEAHNCCMQPCSAW